MQMDRWLLEDVFRYQYVSGRPFTKEELDRVFELPKPKIQSLVGLIEKAKEVKKKND